MGALLTDPPGWRGATARERLAGLYRALAEHHDRAQTSDTVAAAAAWVEARSSWNVAELLDHLLELAAPRSGIEKSPESSSRDEYLARLDRGLPAGALPPRHAPSSNERRLDAPSLGGRGYWRVEAAVFHSFCLGVWFHQHRRIDAFTATAAR